MRRNRSVDFPVRSNVRIQMSLRNLRSARHFERFCGLESPRSGSVPGSVVEEAVGRDAFYRIPLLASLFEGRGGTRPYQAQGSGTQWNASLPTSGAWLDYAT